MENIFQKNFDSIINADIQNLIDIKYKERLRMEYKKEMYVTRDKERKEMLRDISAFANAFGGYLIIGIEADKQGIPIGKFNVINAENERDRIEKSCWSNIEPHIPGLKCKTIEMDTRENIVLVFIPRSLKKPHMINFKQLNQFWIRHNDKKLPMSVEEIRGACLSVENIWKDVKQFLDEREIELRQQITQRGGIVIGCVPALIREEFIDIRDSKIKEFLIDPPNQAGIFTLSFKEGSNIFTYPEPTLFGLRIGRGDFKEVQLFRNGYFELRLDSTLVYQGDKARGVYLNSDGLIGYTVNYFRALSYLVEQFGIESNLVGFISLYNIGRIILRSKFVNQRTGLPWYPEKKLEKVDHLLIPAKQIVSFDNPDAVAKLFLERIWNAFGFEEVPFFKDEKYMPSR